MWQDFIRLREEYLKQVSHQNEAYREFLRDHFIYQIFILAGHSLPEENFQRVLHEKRRPHHPEELKAYDLWQAWQYTKKKAAEHQDFTPQLIRKIAAKVMKHTGKEITTSIGRYDSSLGDYRLGEDYYAVYPIADYNKIPLLLTILCRQINVQLRNFEVVPLIKTAINYLYEFSHIKPFGEGNIETGMLTMNYLFLYHQQPLLIIFGEDRPQALNAIKSKNSNQTPEAFEEFILQEQIKFFKEYAFLK